MNILNGYAALVPDRQLEASEAEWEDGKLQLIVKLRGELHELAPFACQRDYFDIAFHDVLNAFARERLNGQWLWCTDYHEVVVYVPSSAAAELSELIERWCVATMGDYEDDLT
jgi:hypothetical protein